MNDVITDLFEWLEEEGIEGRQVQGAIRLTIKNHFVEKELFDKLKQDVCEYKASMERFAQQNYELREKLNWSTSLTEDDVVRAAESANLLKKGVLYTKKWKEVCDA